MCEKNSRDQEEKQIKTNVGEGGSYGGKEPFEVSTGDPVPNTSYNSRLFLLFPSLPFGEINMGLF